ncbi:glutamyl-tRNA(Gln) amidotransferase subunit A [Luminiphilus syltensis NOR5-1B]|uniref:Glutamyl-tRNA(Gln) amidotransferase subunit A n=1 Tax=Luminiphilus syltensis NOR5-1B TaxID=565045 RepID=B8KR99_9GAMM|nr:Asp-tRNA(Asn)/Glu-tRNA(Gln) amidotransferase subunit GatA [Luminiphilus syltensis]EED34805.1 glutamyl-tRNA(Gln) amidotransferase subunit A [Luminiphilus syltensis NOR5-1B]
MSPTDPTKASATELSTALANGDVSSLELTEHFLERIKRLNPTINAVITVTEDAARQDAIEADQRIAAGDQGPLTGIPLLHKDIFCTNGVLTTCASRMLDNFVPPYDATVVARLRDAGTVMLGKTNMDEFAMGSSNETSFYGPTVNPWDVSRVPGGSSGGSAAAVAAGFAPLSTGTDTGGSIRQPAALCGITGLKPTYGRVSRLGIIAFASSLDQAGPMTRTVEDAALMLSAIAGMDSGDSTSADRPVPDFRADLGGNIEGLRIGIPREYFSDDLDTAIAAQVKTALSELESEGAKLIDIDLPHTRDAIATYYVIAPAEASTNLSRYDGVRFGHRCAQPKDLEDLYFRSRTEGFGDEVKRRILVGTYVLSSGFYDAYFKRAQQVRRIISEDFSRAFEQVDVIAGPATPGTAFPLGSKNNDPVSMYMEDIYTLAVNLAGLPGLSLPAGAVNGLPVGLQLIGRAFDESTLLKAGHRLQQRTDWHRRAPDVEVSR